MTEYLLSVLRRGEAYNRQALMSAAWDTGTIPPEAMGRCKAAADLIEDLTETTADEWNQWSEAFDQKR